MRPVDFPGSNINLVKPESMTDEECESVRAFHAVDSDGYPFFMIAVKPSYEDIQAINRGEPIYIKQLGAKFQPLAAWTMNENDEPNI